jgi:hypothetical protein
MAIVTNKRKVLITKGKFKVIQGIANREERKKERKKEKN